MEHLWTWSGRYFGYRNGNNLWTCEGKHVGEFRVVNVFGRDGRYMGEVPKGDTRLITNLRKRGRKWLPFTPGLPREPVGNVSRPAYEMLDGYEDFPTPDNF
jgi:hypothetical protein